MRNDTRMKSDDLNDLLTHLENEFTSTEMKFNRFWISRIESVSHINLNANRKRVISSSGIFSVGDSVVQMLSFSKMSEIPELSLPLLGSLSLENPRIPDQVTEQLILTLLAAQIRREFRWRKAPKSLVQKMKDTAKKYSSHQIAVLPRQETPRSRNKLTKEQKIERLMSKSFYGPGGVLEGPNYHSSGRASTWAWKLAIGTAKMYYEREKSAREKHVTSLEKLGITPPAYETFSQYLRRTADEFEPKE